MNTIRYWSIAMVLSLLAPQGGAAASYEVEVGRRHHDFVLPRIDTREPVALSQLRGKKVLLIHFASW